MSKSLYLLCLISISILFSNCKEDQEDLTSEIVGEYVGTFSNNTSGDFLNYSVVISKVDKTHILVKPKSGNEFEEWDTEIERFNEGSITAKIGQSDPVITFIFGSVSTDCTFTKSLEGEGFIGRKQ